MSRSQLLYLEDILASMEKVQRYINDMAYDEFVGNELVIDAVVRPVRYYSNEQ